MGWSFFFALDSMFMHNFNRMKANNKILYSFLKVGFTSYKVSFIINHIIWGIVRYHQLLMFNYIWSPCNHFTSFVWRIVLKMNNDNKIQEETILLYAQLRFFVFKRVHLFYQLSSIQIFFFLQFCLKFFSFISWL